MSIIPVHMFGEVPCFHDAALMLHFVTQPGATGTFESPELFQ